ncbi:MAG: hypothetical protein JWR61_4037 [Ferruginibacter sp.]|nr:hypothetical protein [Ferruginibacter sp.]
MLIAPGPLRKAKENLNYCVCSIAVPAVKPSLLVYTCFSLLVAV